MIYSLLLAVAPEGARRPRNSAWRFLSAVVLGFFALVAAYAPAAADPARASDYEVATGDTLSGIAARFGIDLETIIRANSLGSADRIVPGQILVILPVSGISYTVRPGDSLLSIASRFDVDIAGVMRVNEIENPDHIVIGSDLLLPGARPPRSEPALVAARTVMSAPSPAAAPNVVARPAEESTTDRLGRSFVGKITAYSYQAPIGGARGATTRSGTPVRWGTLAVDPLVIPLGSRVMIEGFDEIFIAEDTGGAVRGNHVEIFYPDNSSAVRFGVQTRHITILD